MSTTINKTILAQIDSSNYSDEVKYLVTQFIQKEKEHFESHLDFAKELDKLIKVVTDEKFK
ncbi:MAG TPA: hypothetical protein PKB09_02035 [Candidatus Saccharibacteria bacterium]|nr:hypothetical protein [Candidatus Saccharibacteria bacterium]